MNSNLDLKELWAKQETGIPDTKDLFKRVASFKRTYLKQLVYANILLLLVAIFIVLIWYYFQPEYITTKSGIVLIILAILAYLFSYNQSIPLLLKSSYEMSSADYLQQLLSLKRKQQFLQGIMTNLYFILLSTGLFLYMIEYTMRMKLPMGMVCYGITAGWIAFNWFYIKPKTIRKQREKIDGLINKFTLLTKQLSENS